MGIGVPGSIDKKRGVVRYSNNIKWENVNVVEKIGEYIPLPIYIANDADCAALGEVAAGAGKEYQDVIMLTLGMGVGGGIILDVEIYTGKSISGSELGHMVIIEGGEPCTCGRCGCLEAYVSTRALIRDAKRITGKHMTIEEIVHGLSSDAGLKELIDQYVRRLGTGIVNIANIFRPQLVLLGGEFSNYAETFLPSLREIIKEGYFGGKISDCPKIELAELRNEAGIIGAASLM